LPLVSIVTPTWHRHELLFNRCIAGVQGQTYPNVEHIVVSDGPDPELAEKFQSSMPATDCQDIRQGRNHPVWFYELPQHDLAPHWGHLARLRGIEQAAGDLIAYCDDDDTLRPEHVAKLAAALAEHPEAGWASSLMASHRPPEGADPVTEIGWGPPSCGNIGTPMIMHRREILLHGTWGPAGDFEDWDLVNRWIHAGIGYIQVPEVTVDVWPSLFFGGRVA
jgi:glycosyltransferase involved in cell wall biosynthesis